MEDSEGRDWTACKRQGNPNLNPPRITENQMSTLASVVAIYETHEQAELAIKDLQEAGIDMKSLSIAAKDTHTDEHVVGYYNAGDRMKYWGKMGAFWGGFWGLLLGSAAFMIPGIGPLLVAGPLVGWIVAGLEGAVIVGGVSAAGAGLFSLGIPKDSVLKYDVALKSDAYLLLFHGGHDEAVRVENLLVKSGPTSLDIHAAAVLVA
jgi:hypothetical protein